MSLRAAFLRAPVAFRRITSIFGARKHPIFGQWRNHTGTDYAAAAGTPIRAIGDGVIVFAGRKGGYGNVIDVRHRNGMVSRYGHMRNFAAGMRSGVRVTMGNTIGYVGSTGWATGPHLHFEIRVDGVARDPRLALQSRGGEPIPSGERSLFQKMRNQTLASLSQAHIANIAE
jgi:murein DD-endopeptidase MepM/ murein hydrolase activator NlpD